MGAEGSWGGLLYRRGCASGVWGWAVNKHAMWEAVRKQVISRAGRACESCSKSPPILHVHHRFYETGKADWEYPIESLEALCPRCHGHADELRRKMVRATGMLHEGIAMRAMGFMHALAAHEIDIGDGEIPVLSYEHAYGIGDAYRLSADVVVSLEHNGKVTIADLLSAGGHMWQHE